MADSRRRVAFHPEGGLLVTADGTDVVLGNAYVDARNVKGPWTLCVVIKNESGAVTLTAGAVKVQENEPVSEISSPPEFPGAWADVVGMAITGATSPSFNIKPSTNPTEQRATHFRALYTTTSTDYQQGVRIFAWLVGDLL